MIMKTKLTSDFELLRLERFRSRRRERRGWKRRLGCWLWVIVAALVLALVGAARAETGSFAPLSLEGRGDEGLRFAGVPDWVAFGVVMTLVLAVMGRLAWGWCVEADERSTYEDETWGEGQVDGLEWMVDGKSSGLPTINPQPSTIAPLIPGMVMKPAKHGFILDLQDGARRAHVRVFEFEVQEFTPGNLAEMPVSIDEPQAITRLRQAMEVMREGMVKGKDDGLELMVDGGNSGPSTINSQPSTDSKEGAA